MSTYKTLPVGLTTSVTKLIARSRDHGFSPSLRLNGLRPAGLLHTTTQTCTPPTRTPTPLPERTTALLISSSKRALPERHVADELGCEKVVWIVSNCSLAAALLTEEIEPCSERVLASLMYEDGTSHELA